MTADYLIITMDNCPYCDRAKALLTEKGLTYVEHNIMNTPELGTLPASLGRQTLPLILKPIGGFDELNAALNQAG